MLKTEKKIRTDIEEDSEEEQLAKQELEELAIQANVKIEEENTKKPVAILILYLQIIMLTGITFRK